MKTTKNTPKTTTDLRAAADAAIAAWKAGEAELATAAEDFKAALVAKNRSEAWGRTEAGASLVALRADIRRLEAEDAARASLEDASAAVDAAEVADGDELAKIADGAALHADLVALLAEEERIRAELSAAERSTVARIESTRAAKTQLHARRTATGLPGPLKLPARPRSIGFASGVDERPATLCAVLADGVRDALRANAPRIRQLRAELTRHEASLEKTERMALKERELAAAYDAESRKQRELADAATRASTAAMQAKYAAEQKEREDLAAAYRSRINGAA